MGKSTSDGALAGLKVLDLSRVLAGPSCAQMLGDLGADVIKVERPKVGDETRTWGPPYVTDVHGADTTESAYYLSCNRNKRSVSIEMSKPEGVTLIRRLAAQSDVLIENFKVGGLAKFGLDYESLHREVPRLVYCSITGFGQTGPYAPRAGYDLMVQAIGGLISMTGEPDRPPVKVPVAVNDITTGLYAVIAILTALRHRDRANEGQHIDLGLLDAQIGWLFNQGQNYLTGGVIPKRMGTGHPNSVPYQVFETADGWIMLAANNDEQFKRFCGIANRLDLLADPRFSTNPERVRNRAVTVPIVQEMMKAKTSAYWLDAFEKANIPAGPINTLREVFEDPQVLHREMRISMPHPLAGMGAVDLIGNPIKLSATPVQYKRPPPYLGQHTDEVLQEVLGLEPDQREALRAAGVI